MDSKQQDQQPFEIVRSVRFPPRTLTRLMQTPERLVAATRALFHRQMSDEQIGRLLAQRVCFTPCFDRFTFMRAANFAGKIVAVCDACFENLMSIDPDDAAAVDDAIDAFQQQAANSARFALSSETKLKLTFRFAALPTR